ncbi:BioC: malonyl-acyl carrier protein O-methyltransferase BioC [Tepidimonas alkaliphilus]|uniref:BioC: malonyl-acyl carrier protein O-methyltransferase BioC n=1 Tax=Tepidimonas alkaliphilus TaxID=2588942 RepID=A0A554W6P5_9BURK|nr:biotin synthase [Tepidimonas alkaliphilus]TSE19257.1 BioC: malonyl-acyl carrier protein O-methyltransferase BioC [Tepidimonas alkaliphilus]
MQTTPPSVNVPPGLDPGAAARWWQRKPAASPWLHEWVGQRMAQRLEWIRLQPQAWLAWAPRWSGEQALQQVAQRYPQAQLWLAGPGVWSQQAAGRRGSWLGRWLARRDPRDAQATRAAADGAVGEPVQLVWANMALHAAPDPGQWLQHWLDWLAPDGFVMLSCLGPDTARELRAVHAAHGWPPPAADYVDMHDWGDLLVRLGYAEPVMDMERLTLTYVNAERLLADLRAWGRNWHPARYRALRARRWRDVWLRALERELPRDAQGRLMLTVEVIYGHALKPARPRPAAGQAAIPLQQLREQLARRRVPAPQSSATWADPDYN